MTSLTGPNPFELLQSKGNRQISRLRNPILIYQRRYRLKFSNGFSALQNFIAKVRCQQGDQIGRIFAQWVIVCFGQFRENYRSRSHFWATLFNC
jgi:hypothetical protein